MIPDTSEHMIRQFKVLAGAYSLLLFASLAKWSWLSVDSSDSVFVVQLVCVLGLAASVSGASKPLCAPYRAESLTIFAGCILVLLFASGRLYLSYGSISVSSLAFVAVVAITFQIIRYMLSMPRQFIKKVDDKIAIISLGGVFGTLLSVLVLPWYKLSFGSESFSFSFFDWKNLYDEYGRGVTNIRLLYFETGFVASIVAGLLLSFIIYRGRTIPLQANALARWALITTIVLMGLWSLALVLGMNDIDEDGSVQFGAWLCVVSHVAMAFGSWKSTEPNEISEIMP